MSAVRRPPSGSAGEVRIIGGQWRRSRLPVPDRPGLRPTPDRVRETLFNWLGQDLHGWTVLDAYAGSGALGFEAGSRGAGRVVMLETDAGLVRGLQETRARLGAQAVLIERADALHWMRSAARGADRGCFDLVMLDPPFAAGVFEAAAQAAIPLLRPGGFLYLEAPAQFEPADGMQAHRHLKAGVVHAHLWITPAAAP